ncbi:MAG: polysaccharide biosynthesis protein [Chitinophagales bacterium]|nr:polysaccharide biosynthesis protein [Chitinophagales bacterium]
MRKLYSFHSSRFLILGFETVIVICSLILASIIFINKLLSVNQTYLIALAIATLIYLLGFLLFKTHITVLRYTAYRDLFKIFLSITISAFVLIALSNLLKSSYPSYFLSNYILILSYFLGLFTITLYRLVIRYIISINVLSSVQLPEKRVAIIGTDYQSIITKHYLDYERAQFRYKIVAYFSKDNSLINKTIEGSPVYHIQSLNTMLDIINIDSLLVVAEKGYGSYLQSAKEICEAKNVKLIESQKLKSWLTINEKSQIQNKKIQIEELLQRPPIKLDIQKIKSELADKIVLVTGAAGSIGSEICRQIIQYQPSRLILLDQAESPLFDIENELLSKFKYVTSYIADISDNNRIEEIFKIHQIDIVFHAAAYKHVPLMELHPYEAIKTNLIGTKTIIDHAVKCNCKKFVFVSTDKAVNPTNVMGATKRAAELYVQLINQNPDVATRFITTRFGNVLGSNGSVIPIFKNQIESGGPIKVTHPEITRFFMTIPEACQLVLEAGSYGLGGEIFLFDMGQPVKIIDLARKMIQLYGLEENKDISIEISGLRPGEKLYEELLADKENTLPTHHPKIMIGKNANHDFKDLEIKLNSIFRLFEDKEEPRELVKGLKILIPGYKSNNSEYSELDTL